MATVQEYVFEYFNKHRSKLEKYYPGINSQQLLSEFLAYSHRKEFETYQETHSDYFVLLEKQVPLEYIRNETFFYRSHFYVSPDVLIPRSETEILVEDSIAFIKENFHKNFSIAEIGIGSFALGLSVLIDLESPVTFYGGDISPSALEVAKINLFRMHSKINSATKITITESDRMQNLNNTFDLIVSNPPYIKESASSSVHSTVQCSEPHVALYLPDEKYENWFNELFVSVHDGLTEKGAFFMEGHEDTLGELKKLALETFKSVNIKKDYTGRDRFLYCYK